MDNSLALRVDGSSPRVTATEAGSTLTTRDGTTGKVVIDLGAAGMLPLEGIWCWLIADADTGTSNDKSVTVTIEADSSASFPHATVVATFTAQTYADTTKDLQCRQISTKERYLRSVCTLSGSNGTFSRKYVIFLSNFGDVIV
jgi:hypothetical protein